MRHFTLAFQSPPQNLSRWDEPLLLQTKEMTLLDQTNGERHHAHREQAGRAQVWKEAQQPKASRGKEVGAQVVRPKIGRRIYIYIYHKIMK
jgi:hypothetical protein